MTAGDGARDEVRALLDAVAEAAAGAGDEAAAGRVRGEAARIGRPGATLVFAGEKKRGKTSVINALLEEPSLLPVDADVATSVHLTVAHAPLAVARADGAEIPFGSIAEYAALDPETGRCRHPGVTQVEVGLPHRLLEGGLRLVDSPGVGGLVAGHTAITLAALDRADALALVVNGAGELTASECLFLGHAAQRITTVLFVLTQTDVFPDWEQVRDRNVQLVREHAPALAGAPWLPVSSRDRLDGLPGHGFAELEAAVAERVVGRAAVLGLANAVQVARLAVEDLLDAARTRLGGLVADPAAYAPLEAEEGRLKALQGEGAAWRAALREKTRGLGAELRLTCRRMLNDLQTAAQERIGAGGRDLVDELPGLLHAGGDGICLVLDTRLRAGLARIAARTADGLVPPDPPQLTVPQRIRALPPLVRSTPDNEVGDEVEHAFRSLGAVSMATTALTFALNPVAGVLAGAGVSVFLRRQRQSREQVQRDRADAQRYAAGVIRDFGTEIPAALDQVLAELASRLEKALGAELDRRRQAAESALAVAREAAAASEEALRRDRGEAERTIGELTALAESADALSARLDPQDPRDGQEKGSPAP